MISFSLKKESSSICVFKKFKNTLDTGVCDSIPVTLKHQSGTVEVFNIDQIFFRDYTGGTRFFLFGQSENPKPEEIEIHLQWEEV